MISPLLKGLGIISVGIRVAKNYPQWSVGWDLALGGLRGSSDWASSIYAKHQFWRQLPNWDWMVDWKDYGPSLRFHWNTLLERRVLGDFREVMLALRQLLLRSQDQIVFWNSVLNRNGPDFAWQPSQSFKNRRKARHVFQKSQIFEKHHEPDFAS